jgi:hypothetical protein
MPKKTPPLSGPTRAPRTRKTRIAPVYVPTERARGRVQAFAACGVPVARIALVLDISEDTLKAHYARELEVSADEANQCVAQGLFVSATDANMDPRVRLQAQIAWLKMRAGWSDKSDEAVRVNVTGQNVTVDASTKVLAANVQALDDASLKTLTDVLARLLPPPEGS